MQTRLERWDRPLAFLLLGFWLVVTVAVTSVSNGATRIYSWPWAFYLQASLLAPWFWVAWSLARGRTGLRAGWLVSLPLLTALALSILTSAHWHDALEASLVLATPLLLVPFVAGAWMQASAPGRLLVMRCAGAILTVLALTSLVAWFARAPESGILRWFLASRNPYPLGHWNYTGGLALLALPVTALLAFRERGAARVVWIAATSLALVQFLSAGSRGAVLGLLAGLAMTAVALTARRRWSWRAIAGGTVALVIVVAGAVATNPRLRQIAADPASAFTLGESEQQRLGFILTGVNIGRAHPWTGIGPGTTPYHYPEHRVDIPGSLENSFQLHCGPLQWWVDTGFVGLALLAAVGGFLKWRVWRARRMLSPDSIASIAILGGYGVMWLTDYQLDAPVYPILLALAISILLAGTEQPHPTNVASHRTPNLATIIACVPLFCAISLVPSWRARAEFLSAWAAKDTGDANGFIKHLRAAADSASWHPFYHNHLALALSGIAAHLPPETAAALRADARTTWQRSLAFAPAQDHPWLNLGWLDLAEGRAVEASENFARAAAIQPRRTGLWFATAQTQSALNHPDAAARALTREVRLDPSFITSPLWHDDPFAAMRPAVLALLGKGWRGVDRDPGAAAAPDISAFALWWWTGEVAPVEPETPTSPTQKFLGSLPRINDRAATLDASLLPPALHALRENWRTGASIPSALVPADIAKLWGAHVAAHRTDSFSLLLKTLPAQATRRVQRGADGILFRQADGDPLSDLTEIPASPIANLFAAILPRPAIDELFQAGQPSL